MIITTFKGHDLVLSQICWLKEEEVVCYAYTSDGANHTITKEQYNELKELLK